MGVKIRKSYRFSPRAVLALDRLKLIYPKWTETSIIEAALENMFEQEMFYHRYIADMFRDDMEKMGLEEMEEDKVDE